MNSTPSNRGSGLVVVAILLTLAPGAGALLGTMLNAEQFTAGNLVLSPALALAAGVLLGIRTGESAGAKVFHSLLWAMGAMGFSSDSSSWVAMRSTTGSELCLKDA